MEEKPTHGFLPRTFSCVCGTSHALLDDNDIWWDTRTNRVIGQTECLLAAGLITPDQV